MNRLREIPLRQPRNLPTIGGIPLEPINLVFSEPGRGSIYVSDIDVARDTAALARLGIKAVLTMCPNSGLYYPKEQVPCHRIICAQDEEWYNLRLHFEQAYTFIDSARQSSHVLVHCQAGVSRSPAIVIAYLMRYCRWTVKRAYRHLRARRRLSSPNAGFLQQLLAYEKDLGLGQDLLT
jgi:hypothetical protein